MVNPSVWRHDSGIFIACFDAPVQGDGIAIFEGAKASQLSDPFHTPSWVIAFEFRIILEKKLSLHHESEIASIREVEHITPIRRPRHEIQEIMHILGNCSCGAF